MNGDDTNRDREAYEREQKLMERLKEALEADTPLREIVDDLDEEDRKTLRGFGLLTIKPMLILVNLGESQLGDAGDALIAKLREQFATPGVAVDGLAGKIEMEIGQLDPDDAVVFMEGLGIAESSRARVIRAAFDALSLISFFTFGDDECKAWTLPKGSDAVEAAGKIHSDIARGFIRAEVVDFVTFRELGSWSAAKDAGRHRLEGKEYVMKDGDCVIFRFNV